MPCWEVSPEEEEDEEAAAPFSHVLPWINHINPDFYTGSSLPRPGISPLDGERSPQAAVERKVVQEGAAPGRILGWDFTSQHLVHTQLSPLICFLIF